MKKGWKILIGVVAALLVLGVGAAGGAGLTYYFLRDNLPPVYAAPWEGEVRSQEVEGVIIAWVEPGSAAEKAGLVRGDILLQVGDQDVDSFIELKTALQRYQAGDEVTLTVLHGDETRTLTATLDEGEFGAYLGVSTCMWPARGDIMIEGGPFEFEKEIQIVTSGGVMITEVVKDSPAEAAGLSPPGRRKAGAHHRREAIPGCRPWAPRPGETSRPAGQQTSPTWPKHYRARPAMARAAPGPGVQFIAFSLDFRKRDFLG